MKDLMVSFDRHRKVVSKKALGGMHPYGRQTAKESAENEVAK